MPVKPEEVKVDPEAEFSNAQRIFKRLAPMCSVEKRGHGIPQLATQEKQVEILQKEMNDTLLCIDLARKGLHAIRDKQLKHDTTQSILQYEQLDTQLRSEKTQQAELDCLNFLARKQMVELFKKIPTEGEELKMIEVANLRLKQMENRLDMATKKFCVVNTDNKKIREEINRLLVERNSFNIQWNETIGRLIKGKEYLMDIFEIASKSFGERDECCRKLEALKWKGMIQLNRDISEMQTYEGELNHLAKIEEFLRVKGSKRLCEADEKDETKRNEEAEKSREEIKIYDKLLDEIFEFAGTDKITQLMSRFNVNEVENFAVFQYLCELLQESIVLRKDLELIRTKILDWRDMNAGRDEKEKNVINKLNEDLEKCLAEKQILLDRNNEYNAKISYALKEIEELVSLTKCDVTPLLLLLGNMKEATKWNVMRFLKALELELKSLLEVAYGTVKPPAPTPRTARQSIVQGVKLVADPYFEKIIPNIINKLVPYTPCAYCVEDYIMNLVFETPAVPADNEYVQNVLHQEDPNTKFGIYTLTLPGKRHPFRGVKKE